jgi:hypothetical protein
MTKSDIFLREKRVSVVGTGTQVEDGIERGVFEVSVAKDKTPSIRMSAQQANLNVGGGDGLSPEGDIRINDEEGNTRIQMTGADDGNRPDGEDRVWINGGSGTIALADEEGDLVDITATPAPRGRSSNPAHGSLRLLRHVPNRPDSRGVELTGGGNVTIGDNGTLDLRSITDPDQMLDKSTIFFDADSATATLGGVEQSGTIELGHSAEASKPQFGDAFEKTIELDAEEAQATLGGDGTAGMFKATDGNGTMTAEVHGNGGRVVAGGHGSEGTLLLRHTDANDNSVSYQLQATQQGLVVSTSKSTSGNNPSLNAGEALRIDPDGTVRVKGGSVQPL